MRAGDLLAFLAKLAGKPEPVSVGWGKLCNCVCASDCEQQILTYVARLATEKLPAELKLRADVLFVHA